VLIKSNTVKIAASILVVALFIPTFFGLLYFCFYDAAYMPRSPQQEMGRIFPMHNKFAETVYVNQVEFERRNFVVDVLSPICALVMVFYVGLGMKMGWWQTPPYKFPKESWP
jgi:hypothetical protein